MKTAFITGKHKIEIKEAADPVLVSSTDAIIKIEAVGVCGSDIHYYKEGRIGTQIMKYPETIGHECSGTVMEIASDVKNIEMGQKVAIDPAISCYKCDQCKTGRPHTCRNLKFMGNPGETPGAFSEYIILPARNCFPIPKSMTMDQAAFVEPLSIGYYAASLAGSVAGKSVAILGSGPIGLSTLTSLRLQNPSKVFVTDLLENRLDTAKHYGALWTGNPNQIDIVANILEHEPLGLDYVFECAGEHETLDQGIDLLKPGGTLIIVGIPVGNRVNLSIDKMRRKEIKVQNVRRQNHCVQAAIDLIVSDKINIDPIITHHFDYDEIVDAFDLVAGYKDNVIKAIIRMN
jgi:L-iditol 2-dehydrogenase